MKIKFTKDFKYPGFDISTGTVKDSKNYGIQNKAEEWFQWLIDNGFAEEVKEPGWWKPKHNEEYYCINNRGRAFFDIWNDSPMDSERFSMGNCFKTEEATERWRDYLEAEATVRQDEGVLTLDELKHYRAENIFAYGIGVDSFGECLIEAYEMATDKLPLAGGIYFKSRDYAEASLDKHPDEWKIIANYDWGRE